jgi:probable phosphomutase (TIGR03848 family)
MTTFFLIRHAVHELGGETLAGRLPGVHLSAKGREQAAALAQRLQGVPIKAVYTSPLDRTRETAASVANALGLEAQVDEDLLELGFGEWQGRKIADLKQDELWNRFNSFRSGTLPPGGELMMDTQRRIVGAMLRLRERHGDEYVALVSHADVIKAAVAYFMGIPLDLFQRIEISPASITIIGLADYGPWILSVNNTTQLPHLP